jgi:hypothetical protein
MSAGRYLEGLVLGLVCVGALVLGARRLRLRLTPSFAGPVAGIADGVMLLALLTLALEAAGVIGVLDLAGVVCGCVLVGALAWALGATGSLAPRAVGETASDLATGSITEQDGSPPSGRGGANRTLGPHRTLVVSVAIAATSVVAAAWIGWTIFAYRHGMETIDTIWYHLPAAARFVQLGNIRHLQYFDGDAITVFYPANSELPHAFGMVLFGNDLVSPAIDLCWAAAALWCAWTIGRPWGREPHCLLACLPVLATPGLVDTQPGGAYNDIVCLTLLLASIALIVNARPRPGDGQLDLRTSAFAAIPAALALGSKYTMIVPAIALGLGCVVIAGRGRRLHHAGVWGAALILLGGYWYLRNAVTVGNPLPPLSHIGPLSLPAPRTAHTYTVWQYLTNGSVWTRWYIPGLRESLGLAWWALIIGSVTGALAATLQRRDPRLRVVGDVTLLAGFVFLLTPQLLGIPGAPVFFVDNVRYCAVALAAGLVLLPLWRPLRGARASLAWLAGTALALLFTVLDPGIWRSGVPVKPFAPALHGGPAVAGAGIAAAMLIGAETWLWKRGALRAWAGRLRHRGRVVAAASGSLTAAAILGGWAVGNVYAHSRYRDSPPLPTVYAWAKHIHHARIGIIGLPNQYPLTGPDNTNWVQFIGIAQPHGGYAEPGTCSQWRTAVNRGRYRYVVVTAPFITSVSKQPELRWTQTSPNAHTILHEYSGGFELAVVYRITGRLPAAGCPA